MDTGWAEGLLSDTRAAVASLASRPVPPLSRLSDAVRAYGDEIHAATDPRTDRQTGIRLADALVVLLRRADGLGEEARAIAAVAAWYFLDRSDGEDDLSSPFGFDDDVEVFDAAAAAIAPDLRWP
jgi:hypothetical protein